MAGIATSLTLRDNISNKLTKIEKALERLEQSMNAVNTASNSPDMGKGYEKVSRSARQSGNAVENLNDRQEKARKSADKVKSSWDGVGRAIKAAVTAIISKKAFDITIGGALDLDSMEREFQARLGSNEVGSALFTKLQKQAQTSAFSLEELAKNTSSFLSVTTNPKQIDGLNKIAEQLAVFDKTGQGLEGAGFSLKEALSGDIVSLAERFNMSKAQIRAFGIDQLGKSGDVEGFIEQFNKLLEAQNMGAEAYSKMLESPKTQLNMFLSNMKTGFATASQTALNSIAPLITRLNEWFASDDAQRFFESIGRVLAAVAETIVDLAGKIGSLISFMQTNWAIVEPILWGVVGALIGMKVAQIALNLAMDANPIIAIVSVIFALISALLAWAANTIGLKVIWLTVVNALMSTWDYMKLGIMQGVYKILNQWNIFQLGWQTAVTNIINWCGDMKANVLTILQNMINGAINLINGFINLLNKIPGVNIGLIDQVTFGTEAQLQNEAEKQARNEDLKNYTEQIRSQLEEREKSLQQMVKDANSARAQREADINAAKAEQAQKKAEAAAAKDTSPWDNSTGGSSLGEGIDEVGKVGEVGKVKDDINIAEEDLKFLRDIAEMRYVQNFVTLTPTIAIDAQISEMVDVDEVVSRMEKKLEDEFVSAAEGVYA